MRNINEISQRDCIHSNVYAIVFVYELTGICNADAE